MADKQTSFIDFNPNRDALFLDIDGTLLDIASTPQGVIVPPELIANLDRLNGKLNGALAFVSGRRIRNIDKLFKPLHLCCVGVHGAEWRLSPKSAVKSGKALPKNLRSKIVEAFSFMDGVLIEDKGSSISVHYRHAPSKRAEIKKKLSAFIQPYGKGIEFIPGRMVFEARFSDQNKASAIKRFLARAPFNNRRPVFFGDDITDVSAMKVCLENGGIAVCVGRRRGKQFESPAMVRSWIGRQAKDI